MNKFFRVITLSLSLLSIIVILTACDVQNPVDKPDILGEIEDITPADYEVSDSDVGGESEVVSAVLNAALTCDGCPYIDGQMMYTIKTVTPYHNLLDAGIDVNAGRDVSGLDTENYGPYYWDVKEQACPGVRFPDYINLETGELIDDLYLFIMEVEFTNIDATETHWSNPYVFISNIFCLADRSVDGVALIYEVVYFGETGQTEVNNFYAVELKPGEPKTVHLGFWVYDKNGSDFSKMGLTYQNYRPFEDKSIYYWFNMSEVMANMK